MHDFNFFGGGWMMFFWWFLIIVLVIFAIRAVINSGQSNQSQHKETPMDILKRRYTNGEIDKEEFQRRKQELQK
ncbi:SHOCT domain-containing protein [Aliifodinibius salicampi]|uniref:SHOCT domain-containing protein n=1 Tax=Fodinibius salicampi TaxID=1920655 RepID=A0ABT3PUC6_9BACT|nr:SHOCT domain-containing protein [Fodinibius salicampi]MCW9711453.1 SHOCT domain-containing protein [Fodinibius salicampi]